MTDHIPVIWKLCSDKTCGVGISFLNLCVNVNMWGNKV